MHVLSKKYDLQYKNITLILLDINNLCETIWSNILVGLNNTLFLWVLYPYEWLIKPFVS